MSSNVFAANVYYAGNVIVSQTLNVPTITAQAIYGTSNTSTAAYVPQDFSSSGLNIPAYVVSNTATVANTVAYSSFGPFAGEGSVYFPGGSAPRISFGVQPQFAYNWTSFDFTMECFVYHTSRPYDQRLLSRDGDILMYVSQSNYPNQLVLYSAGITSPTSGSFVGGTVPLNQWNHLAVSYIASTSTVYLAVNGAVTVVPKVTGTFQYTGTNNTNIDYWFGISGTNIGYLSNFRFIRGAALYTTSFTPPTGPLQPIQGTTQAGLPYGTVLLLRNAPAPGRVLTSKFGGANSGSVLSFPPAAMTTYATTLNSGYGQGTYVASASSEATTRLIYLAFDKSVTSGFWQIATAAYTANTPYSGSVATVDVTGTSYSGEWIQIQMPSSIVLSTYSVTTDTTNSPSKWFVFGSRDGTNWSLVDQRSGQTSWTNQVAQTFATSSSQSYNFYRFVVNTSIGVQPMLYELVFNGSIEGPSVSADGRLGLGVSNPVQALEVAGSAVVTGTLSAGNPLMFRNRIINGDFKIDQRNAGASFTVSAGGTKTYTLDRWWGWCAVGSKFSVQRSTVIPTGTGFTNSVLVTSLSAYVTPVGGYYGFGQYIEGYNIADMGFGTASATTVTLSFWARSSIAGTFSVALENGSFNRSYIFNYTISSVNTWQYFTLPFMADTTGTWDSTTGQGFRLWWDLGSSDTTYAGAAGSWLAADRLRTTGSVSLIGTNAATLYIAGAQVEKGSAATPFEFRPYAIELALCQRYYYQITALTNSGGSQSNINWGIAYVRSAGNASIYYSLPVPMRTQPTFFNNATLQFDWNAVANLGVFNSPVLVTNKSNNKDIEIDGTVTGGTQGQAGAIILASPTAGQYVSFNAEL